jgi:adenylate cyclase
VSSFSEVELARQAGSTIEQIRRLLDLGILRSHEDGHRPSDIQRVRLAEALDNAGISFESLGQVIAEGRLSFDFIDALFPEPPALTDKTFRDVAAELGLPPESLVRLYSMWGLPLQRPEDSVREDDAALFADFEVSIPPDALNEPTLIRGARALGESLRKVADTARSFFDAFFEEPALRAGMSRQQVMDTLADVNAYMTPGLERWILWLLHRHSEHNQMQYIIEHVEMVIEESGAVAPRASRSSTIAFLDLSGYTKATEERGDEAAADFALSLARLAQEVASSHGGRLAKLLGDGAMLHFPRADDAVVSAFDLVERVPAAGLPPARVGLNTGPVVVRDGDYFGRTVNIASRLADYARPQEILVTEEVTGATAPDIVHYRKIGAVNLKGVTGPVPLFLASRARE